jgi:hypothetical protein
MLWCEQRNLAWEHISVLPFGTGYVMSMAFSLQKSWCSQKYVCWFVSSLGGCFHISGRKDVNIAQQLKPGSIWVEPPWLQHQLPDNSNCKGGKQRKIDIKTLRTNIHWPPSPSNKLKVQRQNTWSVALSPSIISSYWWWRGSRFMLQVKFQKNKLKCEWMSYSLLLTATTVLQCPVQA